MPGALILIPWLRPVTDLGHVDTILPCTAIAKLISCLQPNGTNCAKIRSVTDGIIYSVTDYYKTALNVPRGVTGVLPRGKHEQDLTLLCALESILLFNIT